MKSDTLTADPGSLEAAYIQQLFEYYRCCYESNEQWQTWLMSASWLPASLKYLPDIGLCNRTFGRQLPSSRTLEGGAIRGLLQRCGLFTPTGGELFRGCIVFPYRDVDGHFIRADGYRYGRVRPWQCRQHHWERIQSASNVAAGTAQELSHGKT